MDAAPVGTIKLALGAGVDCLSTRSADVLDLRENRVCRPSMRLDREHMSE